jgi:hypothetical protein
MRECRDAWKAVAGIGSLAAVALVLVLVVKGLYPADLPEIRNPDFVDNIFDNRGVLWAARLLLVSAAAVLALGGVFIAVSIGTRMKNREWLRRAGPFEISEGTLGQAKDEAEFWHRTAVTSQEETVSLRDRLRQSQELIETFEDSP